MNRADRSRLHQKVLDDLPPAVPTRKLGRSLIFLFWLLRFYVLAMFIFIAFEVASVLRH